ncbi:hypothetical protein CM19_12945 [Candidatus Acidianus copahuensis]|uniref:Uncharacterized protein n=1 Tax=Candidatus Acidianus copahuensis TaxID=1160895 RepID=A0A031LIZ7_9CREN|nr:hypothetical protein [Candidatus Acidianus copahuensis]EZQ01526.1 hypothetical protein CM19_12945 [Candidatus Acidianus copahuensis]
MSSLISSPPNTTFLMSNLYEGVLALLDKCQNLEVGKPPCQNPFLNKDVNIILNSHDSLDEIFKLCNSDKKYKVTDLINCLKSVNVTVKKEDIFLKGKKLIIGGEDFTFQLMKADRYQGYAVMESGLINEQVTVYTDIFSAYLFFLGLQSAYITSLGSDYYFLYFDAGSLNDALQNPTSWLSLKRTVSDNINEVLRTIRALNDEVVITSIMLNSVIANALSKFQSVELRLLKMTNEGRAYKIYEELLITLFSDSPLYRNKELISSLETSFKALLPSAGRFLNGEDKTNEGYHAYKAISWLYKYLITWQTEHLANFMREFAEADKISTNNNGKGYKVLMGYTLKWD